MILKIDNHEVDIDQKGDVAITAGIADIEEPGNSSSGFSKTVEVPFTPLNMRVFGYANELYSREKFNNERHTAEYIDGDTTIMSGIAQIEKITYTTGPTGEVIGGRFHVSVVGASFEWVTAARKRLDELQSDEGVKYTMEEVYANSVREEASLIKFFPVDRGAFWEENAATNKMTPRTKLDIRDYHPFFNVWETMRLIFGKFTPRSSIKGLLSGLYASGYIPQTEDQSYVEEHNTFSIGSGYPDYRGFGPGEVIDVFNDCENADKEYIGNGVITPALHGVRPYTTYIPKDDITVVFDIQLYCRIILFEPPIGFHTGYHDIFKFGLYDANSSEFTYEHPMTIEDSLEYANRVEDLIEVQEANKTHYVYTDIPNAEKYTYMMIEETGNGYTKRSVVKYTNKAWICIPSNIMRNSFMLHVGAANDENGVWVNVWWIIGRKTIFVPMPEGCLTFNKNIKTHPLRLESDVPFHFACKFNEDALPSSHYHIGIGSDGKDCTLKPIIGNYIGVGERVDMSVVGGENTQLDFLAAIRQIFNLMFYTNPLTKEVFIEPRTSFHNLTRNDIIDWREKIDYSKEILVEELGGDIGNALKLAYTEGSEVVQRYNWENRTELGAWTTPLRNKFSDEPKEIVNPIFSPWLLRTVDSVGMIVPQDKPEKTQDMISDVDMDITPIVGHFDGVADRTAGEDLAQYPQYPRLAFQGGLARINLGFGNQFRLPGLNRYYRDNISAYDNGRRLTLYLHLTPQDMEAIQLPNDQKRDFRGVFRLRHNGEDILCTLDKIADYNPSKGTSTKCQFVVDPNIRITGPDMLIVEEDNGVLIDGNTVVEDEREA